MKTNFRTEKSEVRIQNKNILTSVFLILSTLYFQLLTKAKPCL